MRFATVVVGLLLAACGTGAERSSPADRPDDAGAPAAEPPAVAVHGDLRISASTAVLESFPVQLHTTARILNTGAETAELEFPSGCVVLLRAYRAANDGEPAWDQGRIAFCTMALQLVQLPPGDSTSYSTRTDASEILGDSLPDGTYHLRARLTINGSILEIDAGTAQLALPR